MKYHVQFDIELRKNPYKGIYIAFEGIDGAGKTTQAEILKKYLEKKGLPAGRQGRDVIFTKEPTQNPPIGTLIHDFIKGKAKFPPVSLQYLFAADREIHQKDLIEPNLKKGKIVISDRCFWSSVAYGAEDKVRARLQGEAANKRGADKNENKEILLVSESILSMYHQFIVPDATFYISVSSEIAISRISQMKKKQEYYETAEKLKNIQAGYDWLSKKFPDEIVVIDGEGPQEEVTADIVGRLDLMMDARS